MAGLTGLDLRDRIDDVHDEADRAIFQMPARIEGPGGVLALGTTVSDDARWGW